MEHEFSLQYGYAAASFFMLLNASLILMGVGLKADTLKRLLEHSARYSVSITPVAVLGYILYAVQKWY